MRHEPGIGLRCCSTCSKVTSFSDEKGEADDNPLPSPMHPSPCMPAPRAHVFQHVRVMQVHTGKFWTETPHTPHRTTTTRPQHNTETEKEDRERSRGREKRKRTETERREDGRQNKTRQDEERETIQDKTKREETRDKRQEMKEKMKDKTRDEEKDKTREQNIKRSREPEPKCLVNCPPSGN